MGTSVILYGNSNNCTIFTNTITYEGQIHCLWHCTPVYRALYTFLAELYEKCKQLVQSCFLYYLRRKRVQCSVDKCTVSNAVNFILVEIARSLALRQQILITSISPGIKPSRHYCYLSMQWPISINLLSVPHSVFIVWLTIPFIGYLFDS